MRALDALLRDARYAVRAMRRAPGFSTAAVITLAAGIGVNVATLAIAYSILGRPLPYKDSARIAVVNLLFEDGGDLGFSPSVVGQWLGRLRTTEAAAAYYRRDVTVRRGSMSSVVPAALVTGGFFDVFGASAEEGRAHLAADVPELVVSQRRA